MVDREFFAHYTEFGSNSTSFERKWRGRRKDFTTQLKHGLFGGDFRPNRPVTPGSYVRSRVQLDVGRNIITSPLASGLGATVIYERGDGNLEWQRSQSQGFGQRMLGRFIFAARVDAAR